VEGSRRALFAVGKGGLAIAGFAISWPALALTAGFVALDTASQAQRRSLDRRIDEFIRKSELKDLERRIAVQRRIDGGLNRLFSRLLDDSAVDSADMALLRSSIGQEFNEAGVFIEGLQGSLDEHREGQLGVKEFISRVGLERTGSVISELLHARGAIDQQRRLLLLEVAAESLNPNAVPGGHYADALAKDIAATAEADLALRHLIEDLRRRQLRGRNPLARRALRNVAASLSAALSLAFPEEGALDTDTGGLRSTLAIDSAGRVYQLGTSVDIDAIEREVLYGRLVTALHTIVVQRDA